MKARLLLFAVVEGPKLGVPRVLAQRGSTAPQDGDLVRLAEAGEEDDLARRGEGDGEPEDVAPAEGLGDGAADGGAEGAAYQGGQGDDADGGPALLGDEHVADDGRAEDVGGHGEAREGAGGDEERRASGGRGQRRRGDEEHVRPVHHGIPPEHLGQWCDEKRPRGLAELPDRHEQYARGLARMPVVKVRDDPVGHRYHGDTREGPRDIAC